MTGSRVNSWALSIAGDVPPPLQRQQQQRPLPNQFRRAKRVPLEDGQTSGATVPNVDASVAHAATAEVEDHYEDDVD